MTTNEIECADPVCFEAGREDAERDLVREGLDWCQRVADAVPMEEHAPMVRDFWRGYRARLAEE